MSSCLEVKCPKCLEIVKDDHQSICCDICDSWFHLKCSLLRKKDFQRFLLDENLPWFCAFCLETSLPFQTITDNRLRNLLKVSSRLVENDNLLNRLTFKRNCSVCNRKVRDVNNSIPCQVCNCLIHKRCSRLQPCQSANLAKTVQYWYCQNCFESLFPFTNLADNDLLSLTFNSNFTCPCQKTCMDISDYDALEILDLCKLRLSENDPLFDNDIDSHVAADNNFDYYSNHKFHKLINNSCLPNGENKLSLIHTNISSLLGNMDNVESLLLDLNFDFDFIALSETWHTKSNDARFDNLYIPGFHLYIGIQGSSKNGGCGFFIRENLKFHVRNDLNKSLKSDTCEYEAFWVEVENKKDSNLILGVIYNHPRRDPAKFIEYLSVTLKKITKENKKIVLSGDFNLNLLAFESNPVIEDFLNTIFANFLQPLILKPTRLKANQKPSLIDNIFINYFENNAWSGNLIAKISDHMPNFLIIDHKVSKMKHKPEFKRDFKNFIENEFVSDIKSKNLLPINYSDISLDGKFQHFQDTILSSINMHAPLKKVSKRQAKLRRKPWVTTGILKSISVKNKLYKRFLKSKDKFWYQRYKYYRDMLNHLLRKSKRLYFKDYFENHKKNSKKIWMGINDLLGKSNKKKQSDISLKIGNSVVNNQKIVSNHFNRFFTGIAKDLVNKLGKTAKKFTDYLHSPQSNSLFLRPVSEFEVGDEICNLDAKKSADAYDIPITMIKLIKDQIIGPLTTLINDSFTTGYCPTLLKYAKVIPIHKANSPLEVTNYRPISLLPIFNKIIEKLMYARVNNFLEKNNVIFKHQFGFQKNKSTSLAILDVTTKLLNAIENKQFSCCIFLDFAKAFDTVDHETLLHKLEYYGIRGIALQWFRSYLKGRKQSVFVGGELSESLDISYGVPQGSVLGPLLFLLYINDIPSSSKNLDFHLFADDTSLFMSHNDLTTLETNINTELANISDWLIANKLSLNTKKSNYLIFSPKNKRLKKEVTIYINNERLAEAQSVKYLGVLIDNNLNWKTHIQHTNVKISKSIGILSRLRHFVGKDVLISIYNAFIQPHINYGIINWGGTYKSILDPLKKSMKRAVRLIHFESKTSHSQPLFNKSKLLCLDDCYQNECAKFMYDICNKNVEEQFCNLFEMTRNKHSIKTRQATFGLLSQPAMRTNFKKNSIINNGVKIWNSIPIAIRQCKTKFIFKKKFKLWLLAKNTK